MTGDPTRQAVGLVLPPTHCLVLSRALQACGYEVEIAPTPALISVLVREGHCGVWVFDDSVGDGMSALSDSGAGLLPVDTLPDRTDTEALDRWSTGIATKVAQMTAASPDTNCRAIWLLAGSAGAPPAVQAFLNALVSPPPVAFVYAQHFDVDQEKQLAELAPENPAFEMSLLEDRAELVTGSITIISPACRFSLNSRSAIARTGQAWGEGHAPDINQAIEELSGCGIAETGVIIFSGMGSDGSRALADYTAAGGVVWAQNPDDAICGAMPAAAVATGCVSRIAAPSALAAALLRRYSD